MTMPLDTVAHIQVYIARHQNAFGFSPTAVGVHPDHWKGIQQEFKACQRYTEADRTADYNEMYISGVRIIPNRYMEKVE